MGSKLSVDELRQKVRAIEAGTSAIIPVERPYRPHSAHAGEGTGDLPTDIEAPSSSSLQPLDQSLADPQEEDPFVKEKTRSALRRKALGLLARREHSASELSQKLRGRTAVNLVEIETVISDLQADGLQSDMRMAEAYVRYRVQRGQGPNKIQKELQQKGLPALVIQEALAVEAPDWVALAEKLLTKRFGACKVANTLDARAKGQRSRFLLQRGFHYEHISAAL